MSGECIFCKIVDGLIAVPKVYEDDSFICIRDIQPQAKVHLLVIPKKHLNSLESAFPEQGEGHVELMGRLFAVATVVARKEGLILGGFRSIINTGKESGQTIFHIHLHLLGGETLGALC